MGLYVQYGCGLCAPDGWLNFDASPTLRIQKLPLLGALAPVKFPKTARYGDIRKGLPVAERSADAVYCSHVLEHLSLEDFRKAIAQTYRILKPGGAFRLVLPDLKRLAEEYLASDRPDAAVTFMEATLMGRPTRASGISGLLRSWLGNAEHQWMWDFQSLSAELKAAGFDEIRRAEFGDSGDPMFAAVENAGRWNGQLGLQCRRPVAR